MKILVVAGVPVLAACFAPAALASTARDVPLPVPRPADAAVSIEIPLPPPRPADLLGVPPSATPSPAAPSPAAPPAAAPASVPPPDAPSGNAAVSPGGSTEAACQALLQSGKVVAERISPIVGIGGCGVEFPIRLSAIRLASGGEVRLDPAPLMRCELGDAIADWTRDDLEAMAVRAGSELRHIVTADSYDCRGRNRVVGAKLSEHGKGDALDISGVVLADGRSFVVAKQGDAQPFMEAMKTTACVRFSTVLGPGSDGYHENHVHVDLAPRRSAAHYCHWQLP